MEADFPGARAFLRTFRRVWDTEDGMLVGEPRKETVYHVTSLSPDEVTAEQFATMIRGEWSVEVYHGKRDYTYLEDKVARRCNEKLMSAHMIAQTLGLWIASRNPGKTTGQVKDDLFLHPSRLVHYVTKGGLL